MPSNDVLGDEVSVRRRLAALATAMDLAPDVTGEAAVPRAGGAPRPRRGVAVLAAAAVVALVVAIAAVGTLRGDSDVDVSTAGPAASPPPSVDQTAPPVDRPAPATGDEVSDVAFVEPFPSDELQLSEPEGWQPGDLDGSRSTPENAVRANLAAVLGEPTAAATTFVRWPVDTGSGFAMFSATLPSGEVITMKAWPEPGGTWRASTSTIGNTGTTPTALPGDAPNTAAELGVPVVDGAESGRLWYQSGGVTWQMELGPEVMQVIEPAMPGLEGDEDSIQILIPVTNEEIGAFVLVYLDDDGTPITLHSIDEMHCC